MDERSLRIQRRFEVPMVIAALLVIPLIAIEQSDLGQPWQTIGDVLSWGTWLALVTEFVVMMIVVPNRWVWLRRNPIDPIVVFLTPPFLPASLAAARLFRLLRLLRRVIPAMRRLLTVDGIKYAGLLALSTVVVGGAIFAEVEKTHDGEVLSSLFVGRAQSLTPGSNFAQVVDQLDEISNRLAAIESARAARPPPD